MIPVMRLGIRRIVRNAAALSIVLAANLQAQTPTTRPTYERIQPGIERAQLTTRSFPDAQPMRVWIYRPAVAVPAATWPCVFVAPGGSRGTTGVALDPADVEDHLPYVKEGCVVVAYDIDGAASDGPANADEAVALTRAYVRSDGGLANLRAAIALAKEAEPSIDATRLYAAGHDSAGTLALRAAAVVPEIRGVVAYAPILDPAKDVGAEMFDILDVATPGLKAMLVERSPVAMVEKIRVPVMLFGAMDDERVSIGEIREFAKKLSALGNQPLVDEVASGGHVGAMEESELKRGASWIADRARRDLHVTPTTQPSR